MSSQPKRSKRRRGVLLSPTGWQRLQDAQSESELAHNGGNAYTLEQLIDLTGLSQNTLGRIRSRKTPVDRQTLDTLFTVFGLTLTTTDFTTPNLEPQPSQTSPAPPPTQQDWGEAIDVSVFHGRTQELDTLTKWVKGDRCRLISLLGMGGIGKTALAVKFAQQIQHDFEFVIWRSVRNAPPLKSLLSELVPFLSQQQQTQADSRTLLQCLRASRCLVILDNLETLLRQGERAGQFCEGYEDYAELLRMVGQTSHSSCLLLTSREKIAEIAAFDGIDQAVRSIQVEGSPEAALALLDAKHLAGTPAQKENLCKSYGYSPLALQIMGGSIRDIFSGDIALFLAEDTLLFNGMLRVLDHQFQRLSALEKTVMFWLAINRDWTSIAELMEDIYPPCNKMRLLEALESLCWRSLIERRGNTYTQQPVVMEYVTNCLLNKARTELSDPTCFNGDGVQNAYLSTYALLKTTVKDYIRESQERLILNPIAEQLQQAQTDTLQILCQHMRTLQSQKDKGYGAGNLLNLGVSLDLDFTGQDFSHLWIRHAYLPNTSLHQVNFAHSNFQQSIFSQPIGPVFGVDFNPDGSLLATGEGEGRIVIWRMVDCTPILILKESSNWIFALTFNQDGTLLVSEGRENQLNVWDISTGQCVQKLGGHSGSIWAINTHPTKNQIVSAGNDCTLRVWDLTTGDLLKSFEGHLQSVRTATFSPDGLWLASGSVDGVLNLWDVQTGELLNSWQRQVPSLSIRFSPSGQSLAIGNSNGTIEFLYLETGTIERTLQAHDSMVLTVRFSPCGRYLASGSEDRTSKLWDVETGQLLHTSTIYTSSIWCLSFSPNGQYLAVGNNDRACRLWTLPNKELYKSLSGYSSWVTSVKLYPNQPLLVSSSNDCKLRLWNVETGDLLNILESHTDWALCVDCSPCGLYLVSSSSDGTLKLWDSTTGQLIRTLTGHTGLVWSVQFSPNGQHLVSSGFDQTTRLWEVATGNILHTLKAHNSSYDSQARFSPDGTYVASTGFDGTVKLWHAFTGELLSTWTAHSNPVWSLRFSPDGKYLATGCEDATVKIWNLDQKTLSTTLDAHSAGVYVTEYSPDGKYLVTGGDDQVIKLWDAKSYKLLNILEHHESRVTSISFTADSRCMASGSSDETIAIWVVNSGKRQKVLQAPRPYEGMKITQIQGLTDAQKSALVALGAIE